METRSPTLQAGSLPVESQRKPKNTGVGGVGSLSLFQRIFPTQELNWRLLHCRPILYQLNYQGSSNKCTILFRSLDEAKWGFQHRLRCGNNLEVLILPTTKSFSKAYHFVSFKNPYIKETNRIYHSLWNE